MGPIGPQGPPGTWISQPVVDPVSSAVIDFVPKSKKATTASFAGLDGAISNLRITGWDTTASIAFSAAGDTVLSGNLWSLQTGSRGDQLQPLQIQGFKEPFATTMVAQATPLTPVFAADFTYKSSTQPPPSLSPADFALQKINLTFPSTLGVTDRLWMAAAGSPFPLTFSTPTNSAVFIPFEAQNANLSVTSFPAYTLKTRIRWSGMMEIRSDQSRVVFQDVEFIGTPVNNVTGFIFRNTDVEFVNCNFVIDDPSTGTFQFLPWNDSVQILVRGGLFDLRVATVVTVLGQKLAKTVNLSNTVASRVCFWGNVVDPSPSMIIDGTLSECLFLGTPALTATRKTLILQNIVISSSRASLTCTTGAHVQLLKKVFIEHTVASPAGAVSLVCTDLGSTMHVRASNLVMVNVKDSPVFSCQNSAFMEIDTVPRIGSYILTTTINSVISFFWANNSAVMQWTAKSSGMYFYFATASKVYPNQVNHSVIRVSNGSKLILSDAVWIMETALSSVTIYSMVTVENMSTLQMLRSSLDLSKAMPQNFNFGLFTLSNSSIFTAVNCGLIATNFVVTSGSSMILDNCPNTIGPMINLAQKSSLNVKGGMSMQPTPVVNYSSSALLASLVLDTYSQVEIEGDVVFPLGILALNGSRLHFKGNVELNQLNTSTNNLGLNLKNGCQCVVEKNLVFDRILTNEASMDTDCELTVLGSQCVFQNTGPPSGTSSALSRFSMKNNCRFSLPMGTLTFVRYISNTVSLDMLQNCTATVQNFMAQNVYYLAVKMQSGCTLLIEKDFNIDGAQSVQQSGIAESAITHAFSGIYAYDACEIVVKGSFSCMPIVKLTSATTFSTTPVNKVPIVLENGSFMHVKGPLRLKGFQSTSGIIVTRDSHFMASSGGFIVNGGGSAIEILNNSLVTLRSKWNCFDIMNNGRAINTMGTIINNVSFPDAVVLEQNSMLKIEPQMLPTVSKSIHGLRFDATKAQYLEMLPAGVANNNIGLEFWFKTSGPPRNEDVLVTSVSGLDLILSRPLKNAYPAGSLVLNNNGNFDDAGIMSTATLTTLTMASAADLAALNLQSFPASINITPVTAQPNMFIMGSQDGATDLSLGISRKRLVVYGAGKVIKGFTMVTDNEWHHVVLWTRVFSTNHGALAVYLDGKFEIYVVDFRIFLGTLIYNFKISYFGGTPTTTDAFFHGSLAEIKTFISPATGGNNQLIDSFSVIPDYTGIAPSTQSAPLQLDLSGTLINQDNTFLNGIIPTIEKTSIALMRNFNPVPNAWGNFVAGPSLVTQRFKTPTTPVGLLFVYGTSAVTLSYLTSKSIFSGIKGLGVGVWIKTFGPPNARIATIASLTATTITFTVPLTQNYVINNTLVLHPTQRDVFTRLTVAAAVGDSTINVLSTTGFVVGSSIYISSYSYNAAQSVNTDGELSIHKVITGFFYELGIKRRRLAYTFNDGTNAFQFLGNKIVSDDQWHYLYLTHTPGRNIKFYVDGMLDAQYADTTGFSLLAFGFNALTGYHGVMSEMRWEGFSTPPTDTQVMEDYRAFTVFGKSPIPRNPVQFFNIDFNSFPMDSASVSQPRPISNGNNSLLTRIWANNQSCILNLTGFALTAGSTSNYVDGPLALIPSFHRAVKNTELQIPVFSLTTGPVFLAQMWIKTTGPASMETNEIVSVGTNQLILAYPCASPASSVLKIVDKSNTAWEGVLQADQKTVIGTSPVTFREETAVFTMVSSLMELCSGNNVVFACDGVQLMYRFVPSGASNPQEVRGKTNICDDLWHHVAVMHHRGNGLVNFFVDGEIDGNFAVTPTGYFADVTRIGRNWNGKMDDVRFEPRLATFDPAIVKKDFTTMISANRTFTPRFNMVRYSFDTSMTACDNSSPFNGTLITAGEWVEGYEYVTNVPNRSRVKNATVGFRVKTGSKLFGMQHINCSGDIADLNERGGIVTGILALAATAGSTQLVLTQTMTIPASVGQKVMLESAKWREPVQRSIDTINLSTLVAGITVPTTVLTLTSPLTNNYAVGDTVKFTSLSTTELVQIK
jgi:hypothetical protein